MEWNGVELFLKAANYEKVMGHIGDSSDQKPVLVTGKSVNPKMITHSYNDFLSMRSVL